MLIFYQEKYKNIKISSHERLTVQISLVYTFHVLFSSLLLFVFLSRNHLRKGSVCVTVRIK